MLGRLLRHGQVDPAHLAIATAFWDAAISTKQRDGLDGFGWMAEVVDLEEAAWASRTLRTLEVTGGSIDWSHKVAERAASQPPNAATLAIMNLLIRGAGDPWHQRQNVDVAVQLLHTAEHLSDTAEYQRLRTSLQERNAL